MKRNRLSEKGFGAIEALVSIVTVAILIGSGLFVYYQHHKKTATTNDTNTSASSTTNKTPTSQKYLTIKEWGVKLPLSSVISDAYYVASTSTKDANGQPNTMWLGVTSLDGNGCDAAQTNSGGHYPLAALLRVAPDAADSVSGTSYKQLYPNGTTIGSYYYALHDATANQTCAPQATLQPIGSAFSTAAKSIIAE